MIKDDFFTAEEKTQITELYKRLYTVSKDVLLPDDDQKVRYYIREAGEKGLLQRDTFNLNPIINDAETALIVAEEIGLNRASILGVMLNGVVLSGAASIDEIKKDFGEDVAHILYGMLRIRDLYAKSATVESENFRSLLVTFAEDLRVILIMIANRVLIMRKIKDTPYVEAQRRVSMEAAYLYAPLAHKLGLYKLKSELEDLSLKYLEHDAYYHIKEKLNETKRSRDAYIANFIAPIDEKLRAAGLKFHMKGRTKSIHSIWQKMKKQQVDIDGVYDLFAIRIILDSKPEKEKQDCWQVFSIITDMYQCHPCVLCESELPPISGRGLRP